MTDGAAAYEWSRRSLRRYLENLLIASKPLPLSFGKVAEPWQWASFAPIIPALEGTAGLRVYDGPSSFWFTRRRGSDKTSSIARFCNWALVFTRRPLRISVGAGDKKQAKLVRDAMEAEAHYNPWFGDQLKLDNFAVSCASTRSELEILSSDGDTSFGLGSDLYVADELTHWKGVRFWTSLLTGRDKNPGALFIVITNAGYHGTWQHALLEDVQKQNAEAEAAGETPMWVVDETCIRPGWIDPRQEASDRRLVIASTGSDLEVRRLFENAWVDATMDSVFNYADLERMFSGGKPALQVA